MNKSTAIRICLIVFSAIIFYFLLLNFERVMQTVKWVLEVFIPLFVGISFAFIINPLTVLFDNNFKIISKKFSLGKSFNGIFRFLSIVLSFLIFFGIITLIFFIIIPEVGNNIGIFVSNFQNYLNNIKDWAQQHSINFYVPEEILKFSEENLKNSITDFVNFLKDGAGNVVSGAVNITVSFISTLWNIIFGLIISIYLLIHKESIMRFMKRFVCAFFSEKCSEKIFYIANLSNKTFANFVIGQLVEAVIIGVLCYLGMIAFMFPYALSIATIIGFTALIPIFGAWIGAITGGLLIAIVSPVKALWFLVFIIVLQQLEGNIIYPKVVGKTVGTPSLLVMLAVWMGGSMFGILGMLFGVPITSIAYTLIKECIDYRLKYKDA